MTESTAAAGRLTADWRAIGLEHIAVLAALAGITVWGLILRLNHAWTDMPDIVEGPVPDDAFY